MSVGGNQASSDHESRALLDLATAERHHFQSRRSRQCRSLSYLGRVGIGNGARELNQTVSNELEALVAQETLGGRKSRRDGGHDVGDRPDYL